MNVTDMNVTVEGSGALWSTDLSRPRSKGIVIGFWIVTALFCLQIGFTAYAQLRLPQVAEAFTHLGFPAYFRVELSWAKLLGVVLLLAPVPARLKEWAYAGFAAGFPLLRRFRLARPVEGDRLANERRERGLVNGFSFVDVDRAAYVSVETRVEETGRILQRRALGEGKLHDILVGFASADDAVVRPNRSAHPLPLLDDVRVCFLDELAHSAESFPAPVPEFDDSFRDELRCRLALARA